MASSSRFNPRPTNVARKLLHSKNFYKCIFFEKGNFFSSNKFQVRLEDEHEDDKNKRQMSIFLKFDSDNSFNPYQMYVEYSIGMEFEQEKEPESDPEDVFSWRLKNQNACALLKSMKLENSIHADAETKEMLISIFPVKMGITVATNVESTTIDWQKFHPTRSDGVMVINSPPLKWRYLPDLPERVVEYMADRSIIRHGTDKLSGKNHYFVFDEGIMVQAKRKGNRMLSDANQRLREKLHSPTYCSKFYFHSIFANCINCGNRFCADTVNGESFLSPLLGENKTCRMCTG